MAASVRFEDAQAAEPQFAEFMKLKPSLPPGHGALIDAKGVRKGLSGLGG